MYGIYCTIAPEDVTGTTLADAIATGTLIDRETDWPTAVWLAQQFAHDHAARIDVTATPSGNFTEETGATFTTNNGTRVWYTAKPLHDRDLPQSPATTTELSPA